MLSPILFEEDKINQLKKLLSKKNFSDKIIDEISSLSVFRKKLIAEVESLKSKRNLASQEVGKLKSKLKTNPELTEEAEKKVA